MKRSLVLFLVLIAPQAYGTEPDASVILVMGDSLSAGYGLEAEESWPSLLEKRLQGKAQAYRVVNASISGDTTRGGRSRLPRALKVHRPDIVIVELGANDGLRGLPVPVMRGNLAAMLTAIRAAGADALILGMHIPSNYGPDYTQSFHAVFGDLAGQFNVPLVPFLLDGVALDRSLMQSDGIHPNALAQPRLLDNVWPVLEPLL